MSAFYFGGAIISRDNTRSKENPINEEIRAKEVRVVDDNGQMLGVMPIREALALAAEKNLDLVAVSPNAVPPVCKILDYGKYRYDMQKREKEAKKNQKVTEVKEIRLSVFIETHDLETKAKTCSKFLKDGNKVKVGLRFRGREVAYVDRGLEVMNSFAELLKDVSTVEKKATLENPRNLSMILVPKSDK